MLKSEEALDQKEHHRKKLTFLEALVAAVIALTCVSFSAVFLVQEIDYIVERGVPSGFLGLILVPLVEKAAEHIGAIDDAWYD